MAKILKKERLIVDGYNMIGSWPNLVKLKNQNEMEEARDLLLANLSNYAAYNDIETWVIFDAMFVPGLSKTYEQYRLYVVFTGEGETADSYIEAMIDEKISPLHILTVATSDLAEQWLVFQKGALRKSAQELWRDIKKTETSIRKGDDDYTPSRYNRLMPWKEEQIIKLKNLYSELSEHQD